MAYGESEASKGETITMIKKFVLGITAVAIFCFTPFAVLGLNFQPGNWEISTGIVGPGNGLAMREKNTVCLSENDIVPQLYKESGCKKTSVQVDGDTISWVMRCPKNANSTMDVTGRLTYFGNKFKGVITYSGLGTVDNKINISIKGRLIGDCISSDGTSIKGKYSSEQQNKVEENDTPDEVALDVLLKSNWERMKKALTAGKIEEALSCFTESSRDSYRKQFTALSEKLPMIAGEMGPINLIEIQEDVAIYDLRIIRDGKTYSHQLLFILDADEIWRIGSF